MKINQPEFYPKTFGIKTAWFPSKSLQLRVEAGFEEVGHKGRLFFILVFDLRHSCSEETGKTLCLVTRQWLTASLMRPATSVLLFWPLWVIKGFIFPTPGMLTSLLLNVPEASLKSQNDWPVFVSLACHEISKFSISTLN